MDSLHELLLCDQQTAMREISSEKQPDLCARLATKRNATLHRQSCSAYEALFRLYEGHTDLPMPRICYRKNGKPYFEGNVPHFSLSHTDGMSLACLSFKHEIGADIESFRRAQENGKADAYRALAVRMFFRKELDALSKSLTDDEFLIAFLSIYTQKEALAKLLSVPVMQINTKKLPKNVYVCTVKTENGAYIYSVALMQK